MGHTNNVFELTSLEAVRARCNLDSNTDNVSQCDFSENGEFSKSLLPSDSNAR